MILVTYRKDEQPRNALANLNQSTVSSEHKLLEHTKHSRDKDEGFVQNSDFCPDCRALKRNWQCLIAGQGVVSSVPVQLWKC